MHSDSYRMLFQHQISRFDHPQTPVGLLGSMVLVIDIESQADDRRIVSGGMGNVFKECPEDAAAAGLQAHVDALNPPKPAVAPIAPFGRDHDLPNHKSGILGQKIKRLVWIG